MENWIGNGRVQITPPTSFPGLAQLQFLIACSIQERKKKKKKKKKGKLELRKSWEQSYPLSINFVYLSSTWCHDKCPQAFPFSLLFSFSILMVTQTNRKQGRPRQEASWCPVSINWLKDFVFNQDVFTMRSYITWLCFSNGLIVFSVYIAWRQTALVSVYLT